MVREYPKIPTLFKRDKETFVVTDELTDPAFNQIRSWLLTEKIDGTNIRISLLQKEHNPDASMGDNCEHCFNPWTVQIDGRTAAAQLPPTLVQYLLEHFTLERMKKVWLTPDDPYEFTLYGEGYGEGIQKGGYYRKGVSFRLFDVLVADKWWLDWENIIDVANKLGIKTVPALGSSNDFKDIVSIVKTGRTVTYPMDWFGYSWVAENEAYNTDTIPEGIVARTDPYLYDKNGHPLKFKLKRRDFERQKKL